MKCTTPISDTKLPKAGEEFWFLIVPLHEGAAREGDGRSWISTHANGRRYQDILSSSKDRHISTLGKFDALTVQHER